MSMIVVPFRHLNPKAVALGVSAKWDTKLNLERFQKTGAFFNPTAGKGGALCRIIVGTGGVLSAGLDDPEVNLIIYMFASSKTEAVQGSARAGRKGQPSTVYFLLDKSEYDKRAMGELGLKAEANRLAGETGSGFDEAIQDLSSVTGIRKTLTKQPSDCIRNGLLHIPRPMQLPTEEAAVPLGGGTPCEDGVDTMCSSCAWNTQVGVRRRGPSEKGDGVQFCQRGPPTEVQVWVQTSEFDMQSTSLVVRNDAEDAMWLRQNLACTDQCFFCKQAWVNGSANPSAGGRAPCFASAGAGRPCPFVREALEFATIGDLRGRCGVCHLTMGDCGRCGGGTREGGEPAAHGQQQPRNQWVCFLEATGDNGYGFQCSTCGLADCGGGEGVTGEIGMPHPILSSEHKSVECNHRLLPKAAALFLRTQMGQGVLHGMAGLPPCLATLCDDHNIDTPGAGAASGMRAESLAVLGRWLNDTGEEQHTEFNRIHTFVGRCARRWLQADCPRTFATLMHHIPQRPLIQTLHDMRQHVTSESPRQAKVLVYIVKAMFENGSHTTQKGRQTFKVHGPPPKPPSQTTPCCSRSYNT